VWLVTGFAIADTPNSHDFSLEKNNAKKWSEKFNWKTVILGVAPLTNHHFC
jgi:hypothetical protein